MLLAVASLAVIQREVGAEETGRGLFTGASPSPEDCVVSLSPLLSVDEMNKMIP